MIRSTSTQRQLKTKDLASLFLRHDLDGKGRGVFAGRSFHPQEEVLEFLGDRRDVADLADLTYALQIGPRLFLTASGGVDDYVNHSCQPNCGIRLEQGRVILVALRLIDGDEEITFDYSTTQTGGFWAMTCQCGTANCRQLIGDFHDLPTSVKDFYISRRAVLPYLLDEVSCCDTGGFAGAVDSIDP